ncbi:unnamed protein product [Mytilus edulis]|uniref:Uncharacterized protein n=1 Tax=Mytilus edulis TaxID=6550 RepID=A0A8S3SGY6_MYTED|nr:unnamed protein product [Mytilus edulis]
MTRNKLNTNAKRKLKDLSNNTDPEFDSPTQQPYKKGSKKLSKNNTSVHSIHEGLSSDKTPDNQKHAYNTQTSTPLHWPPPPVADNNVLGHIMQYITTIDSRLSNLENMDKKIDKLESFCENMENLYIRVKKTETGIETLTSQMTEVQDICVSHKIKLDELCVEKDTMWVAIAAGGADLQCESLKQNLVFYGVVDQPGENTDSLLKGFIRSEINIKSEIKFVNVRRINSKFNPRPILASFESLKDREKVRRSAYRLKGTPFSLSEQYPSDILAKRKRLIPILKEARSQNVKAVLLKDKLYIDNDVFDPLKHKQFIKESTVAFPSGASSGNSKAKSTVGSNDDDPDPNSSMAEKED